MIVLEDRQTLARDIYAAHEAGARLQPACEIAGHDLLRAAVDQASRLISSNQRQPIHLTPTGSCSDQPGHLAWFG